MYGTEIPATQSVAGISVPRDHACVWYNVPIMRLWAFWRRLQYVTGVFFFWSIIGVLVYYTYWYTAPTCFDERKNGEESGIDCGGACVRICAFSVIQPSELWVRAFKIRDGQYNAIAYVENRNINVGTAALEYTLALYDSQGLIVERKGTTILPPDGVYPVFEGRIDTGSRVPTQTVIALGEDSVWVPAESGREQFKVERRELKSADTLPVLTSSLLNTSLEEATDVEVVATIFDAKGNALTASQTVVPYFPGRKTKDVVFTWPTPISKTLRTCEVPTDIILGIDLSGSMNSDGGTPPEPVTSVLNAAGAFVARLKSDDKVGVVTYATEAVIREGLTENKVRIADVVRKLTIAESDEQGSTNTGDAIYRAQDEFSSGRHNPDARKVFVLLSDGLANAPEESPEEYAVNAALALKATGVEVFTIGLGGELNDAFLQSIASSNDQYLKAATAGTVDAIYRSITGAICEDGAAVIEIIPKTSASFTPLR